MAGQVTFAWTFHDLTKQNRCDADRPGARHDGLLVCGVQALHHRLRHGGTREAWPKVQGGAQGCQGWLLTHPSQSSCMTGCHRYGMMLATHPAKPPSVSACPVLAIVWQVPFTPCHSLCSDKLYHRVASELRPERLWCRTPAWKSCRAHTRARTQMTASVRG